MAVSKRQLILEAASSIIMQKGINHLTLEEVAAEAGVSKGGLLYHFSNKDELIKGLNVETIKEYRELVQEALDETGSYTKSFLLATLKQLDKHHNASSSMLAALSTNKEWIKLWDEDYQRFREEMVREEVPFEVGMIVRLVSDGLLYSRLFESDPLHVEEEKKVVRYLLDWIDKEKSV
ncbi:TetR/AcrR family transcriptional regulator [Paenibacillus sp. 1001270B_150601_E10]|uniref:TetR/AcrR family transcriptional regulator n=1 Tax=Paenibacillus sp. 1001270B_150601_E10 TaxID=2787079 RepID=UPI0018A036F0|nr:TetR/AcrR family transcriptional regulator [Paenibacillus sp. 1001270B_150601_E10]